MIYRNKLNDNHRITDFLLETCTCRLPHSVFSLKHISVFAVLRLSYVKIINVHNNLHPSRSDMLQLNRISKIFFKFVCIFSIVTFFNYLTKPLACHFKYSPNQEWICSELKVKKQLCEVLVLCYSVLRIDAK